MMGCLERGEWKGEGRRHVCWAGNEEVKGQGNELSASATSIPLLCILFSVAMLFSTSFYYEMLVGKG